ncbi:MAG: DUF1566 domain-containing protein [Thermodesulfobacteriota bacterium]|nr:DUF1566 domain-containing protein [Thermodesulfobacteriota bacterium]
MYTIEDIYNRLDAGTTGAKRSGAFTEPSAGPTATGHTLNEVMEKAPFVDDDGAGVSDVASDKKFWGLTSGAWGLQTGTSAGGGSSAGVARTGQTPTVPFDAPDGSDGKLQKGVAWPNPRFKNNGDDTVTDKLTELMWAQNANAEGTKTWAAALTYCKDLSLGGHDDWRLPNVKELTSLIDWAYYNPALSNDAGTGKWGTGLSSFSDVQTDEYYWSSTTCAYCPAYNAWYVYLKYGWVRAASKTTNYHVWPVRGGQ